MRRVALTLGLGVVGMLVFSPSSEAVFHLWDTNELFSNADGTIQFVEMTTSSNGQGLLDGHALESNSTCFTFNKDLEGSTTNKSMLLGTAAFAALPGAPSPDFIIPNNFINVNGDTIRLRTECGSGLFDSFTFGAGQLPTDGINSLNRDLTTGVNSPTNFSNQTGSVDAGPNTPPAVPDGSSGSPMLVDRLNPSGTELRIGYDDATCSKASDHHLVFGSISTLPTSFVGMYGLDGSLCDVGITSPFDWTSAPDASAGFIWWVLIADDDSTTEGSWGRNSGAVERTGPGAGGVSGECGITTKDTGNSCGQ